MVGSRSEHSERSASPRTIGSVSRQSVVSVFTDSTASSGFDTA